MKNHHNQLKLNHINGDNTDNRIENIQLLCHKWHSYTDNYGGKNQKINKKIKLKAEKRKPVGYIPAGSTNDFGNSLGIDKNMLNAARISVSDNLFPCDIGRFNSDSFVYVAAFGIFTSKSIFFNIGKG